MSRRIELARRALDWVERSQSLFARPAKADDASLSAWIKSLGEVALAGHLVATSAAAAELGDRGRGLLGWAWSLLEEGRVLERLLEHAPARLALITIYPSFYRHGMTNQTLEELAVDLGKLGNRQVALPLAALMRTVGKPGKPLLEAARSRWLLRMQPGWMLGTQLGYSVTHTVFYLTDFGEHHDGLTSELLDYLRLWVPVWTEHYRRVGNFDLLGELIMIGSIVGQHAPASAWDTLITAQHDDGMVPAARGEPPPDGKTPFERNYHATLVAIAAVAIGGSDD